MQAHERMSSIDTAWLRMDGPVNSMMIVGVGATETPVRLADFRRMLESRFLCFPRFRHRPVADSLGGSWVEDRGFDLDAHLVRAVLAGDAGQRELEALAAELASESLDPRRPMWQLHLVERYGSGSAWIMRVHHCYADGIAMIRVLLSMTEQDSGPAMAARATDTARAGRPPGPDLPDLPPWLEQFTQPAGDILEHALAEGAHFLEQGVHQVFHPLRAAELAGRAGGMAAEFTRALAMPDDPDSPLRGPLSGVKRIAWTDPLALDEVRTIGRALSCTVNDVLMSTVAGALGRHLRELDFDTGDLVLRASMPVNLRQAEEPLTLGNKFGLVFVELPLGIRNPLERVFTVHDSMASLKGSLQPAMSLMTLGLMGLLPAAVQGPAIDLFSRKASAVVSNVPGPQAPLKLCGQRISEMYFWVPQSGSIGVGISVLSYAGKVHFGVIADRELEVEPRRIADAFAPEFERLLLATTMELLALKERDRKSAD
ncbi:MAG TPA: wax ester/triacylglycerol synthase family O-acyltransferase [Steroidobacteraceae bacterium]|nr:wax ester/triacylglycerol synthase family O-acyltransferase [Steroidobacteraceae bacterium]